jgi:hypothetical protein
LAMLGFVIAVGTYLTTGQIIPGVWWFDNPLIGGFLMPYDK